MTPKLVKKLADKKYRRETGLFLVEGEKNITELLASDFVVHSIYGTPDFLEQLRDALLTYQKSRSVSVKLISVKEDELVKMGTRETNNAGIAVAEMKKISPSIKELAISAKKEFILVLDDVRDPGNLGTIIRLADWFGITHVVASETTTDIYNPKTIAATMGSFTRVTVTYVDLQEFLPLLDREEIPVMGAYLDGVNIHEAKLPKYGALLMGSESHGVSNDLAHFVTMKVTIPRWGWAESLNVSVATGILLDALRRG